MAAYDYISGVAGYVRSRADWVSWPSLATPFRRQDVNQWDQAIFDLKGLTFNAKDFGALGNGSFDDTGGIVAAISAAASGSGTVFFPPGTYRTTSDVALPANVRLLGAGLGSIIKPVSATGTRPFATSGGGLTGAQYNLASNGVELANTVTLSAGAGANFAADDYIYFADGTNVLTQITRIKSIATDTLTLQDPLYETFASATTVVQKIILVPGVVLQDLSFDFSSYTGANSFGCFLSDALGPKVLNCSFSNATAGGVVYQNRCYRPVASGLTFTKCGNLAVAAITVTNSTGFIWDNIHHSQGGFGPLIGGNGGTFSNIISTGAGGRAIKLAHAAYNSGSNLIGNFSADTGLAISLNSHHNTIHGVQALDNKVNEGIWFSGQTNHNNVITEVVSRGNNLWDVAFNATDTNNYVEGDFEITKVKTFGDQTNRAVCVTGVASVTSVASAATIAVPLYTDYVQVTGVTTITSITASRIGRVVQLQFTGILTVTDGSNLKLNGNFVTTADDTLTLVSDGTNWVELGRSAN